jgi:hypothetical protein
MCLISIPENIVSESETAKRSSIAKTPGYHIKSAVVWETNRIYAYQVVEKKWHATVESWDKGIEVPQ